MLHRPKVNPHNSRRVIAGNALLATVGKSLDVRWTKGKHDQF
jgi:hypothetical protein